MKVLDIEITEDNIENLNKHILRILKLLLNKPRTINEIINKLNISRSTVLSTLKKLESMDLLEPEPKARSKEFNTRTIQLTQNYSRIRLNLFADGS